MINNDFNERPAMQEPQTKISFDVNQLLYTDELNYEEKLIDLMCDLCRLLEKKYE